MDWLTSSNAALFTDLYQLTMLQAYFREGMREEAVFDLFVRRLGSRNYLLACGLDTALSYLENVRFDGDALGYLSSLGKFDSAFLDYLAEFRFTGSVYAVREGTPVFASESILQVVAPIGEAQLAETFLLNQITFQTGAATKCSRVRHAAGERIVSDFGMRRMHAGDAGLKAARAFYIAGADSTSNVLAGRLYGIPVAGTMAHSYVEAHGSEREAFRAFASIYESATLLVDTFDTLEGVRKVVELAHESGGTFSPGAIRLDSGDLAELAIESRTILDSGGLEHVKIFASGSLDEFQIAEFVAKQVPIDGFGVGTKMGTISDQPYLDSVYKLSEYAGAPRMKLSSRKSNLPGRKQVYRYYEDGKAAYDIIATELEALEGEPLSLLVMKDGTRIPNASHSLDEIRDYARAQMNLLPDELKSLEAASTPYEVRLSSGMEHRLMEMRTHLEGMRK